MTANHFVMLSAANVDCVPLFRLAIEGHGVRSWSEFDVGLEFFVHAAAVVGSSGVVAYLLEQGSDPNAQKENQPGERMAPLMWAIQSRSLDTVRALLAAPGIDTHRIDSRGKRALQWAVGLGNAEMVQVLLDHGDVLTTDDVCSAMASHDAQLVSTVHKTSPNYNDTGRSTGVTPLQAAIAAERVHHVRLLLEAGADPSLVSRKKYKKKFAGKSTARDFAAQVGNADILALLP